jgi:hypothetical protein
MNEWPAEISGLLIDCPRCGFQQPIQFSHLDAATGPSTKIFFCNLCGVHLLVGWTPDGKPWGRLGRKSDLEMNA